MLMKGVMMVDGEPYVVGQTHQRNNDGRRQ